MLNVAVSYQIMLQHSNRTHLTICWLSVIFLLFTRRSFFRHMWNKIPPQDKHSVWRNDVWPPPPEWLDVLQTKTQQTASRQWYCRCLDVTNKSTIDLLTLKCSVAGAAPDACTANHQKRAPNTTEPPRPWGLQAGARLTDCCNKVLTSLSQTATSQARVGWGGKREERLGVVNGNRLGVTDTGLSMFSVLWVFAGEKKIRDYKSQHSQP